MQAHSHQHKSLRSVACFIPNRILFMFLHSWTFYISVHFAMYFIPSFKYYGSFDIMVFIRNVSVDIDTRGLVVRVQEGFVFYPVMNPEDGFSTTCQDKRSRVFSQHRDLCICNVVNFVMKCL
jgi:hypothetical protein